MTRATTPSNNIPPRKALRIWPGVVAVTLQWIVRFIVPLVTPGSAGFGLLGGLVGGILVLAWWLFFSRAPWAERLGALAVIGIVTFATSLVVHESIATGMMGLMLFIFAFPGLCLALVFWAVISERLSTGPRLAALVASTVLACAGWILVRTHGLDGEANSDLDWRWAKTSEEKLLVQATEEPVGTTAIANGATSGGDWPGFRGAERDSVIRGVRIATDWAASPPVERWRKPVGPAWSSFAVSGDQLYTQEQRGEEEVVACYRLSTGEAVWKHSDATRFWESNGGAGPRGTPTLRDGRVYSLGATGILNVLDARDGTVIWTRNAATDTKVPIPDWGFSSSPLVVDDIVIVATAGTLAGYDRSTGVPRWLGPAGKGGYSSPHRATINGIAQVILLSGAGATSVTPTDGKVLWQHAWSGLPIVQPTLTAEGDVLIGTDKGIGRIRPAFTSTTSEWTTEERWKSNRLKPYFNDFVVHNGHAYGFDSGVLACINIEDGSRKWKGGRYGQGQLVLLADQGVLLVVTEQGDLTLVSAAPDQSNELARISAVKGKTWNHPVLVGDTLLVRNDQEMVAYRITLL